MIAYHRPASLAEALAAAAERPWTMLAGGTDVYPGQVGKPVDAALLDLTRVGELKGIRKTADGWRLGAALTWSELLAAELPRAFDALRLAAREIGGLQIQNAGTIGGNLCNASPAADGVPPLLALDATVELASVRGARRLALAEFLLGNRRTARSDDEILVAIHIPDSPWPRRASTFVKLGSRRYLVISFVMVAVHLAADGDGRVQAAAVVVGACSPTAQRLSALEAALVGQPAGSALAGWVTPAHLAALAPIDDVRSDAGYRREAAFTLVRRTLAATGEAL